MNNTTNSIYLLVFFAYIEHLFIYWYYSIIWSIKNQQRLVSCKHEAFQVAIYSLKIQLFLLPIIGFIFIYFYSNKSILDYPEFSLHEIGQWTFMFLYEDFIFYHTHRLLHTQLLYHLHKLHHTWKKPVPWATLYASIPENILANFFPVLSAPIIVNLNIYYFFIWIAIATLTGIITHSNFDLPHSRHHQKFTVNYGSSRLFDVLYGTYE